MLNDCRAGLHGGGSAALISDTDSAEAGDSNLAHLQGPSPSARARREAIYRSAAFVHSVELCHAVTVDDRADMIAKPGCVELQNSEVQGKACCFVLACMQLLFVATCKWTALRSCTG